MELDKIIYNCDEYYSDDDKTYHIESEKDRIILRIPLKESEYNIIDNKIVIDDSIFEKYKEYLIENHYFNGSFKNYEYLCVFVFGGKYFSEDYNKQDGDIELSINEFAIKRLLE